MEDKDRDTTENAIRHIKEYRKEIVEKFCGAIPSVASGASVSMFMAGSPGAGKTETSNNIIVQIPDGARSIARIDADEIRVLLPGYDGKNAYLFQYPASLGVDYVLNTCFDKKKHFILDGTFSSIEKARKNIKRAIGHNRIVVVIYVFQRPEIAWNLCKKREALDGRFVSKDVFIKKFFDSKDCVRMVKQEFGDKIMIWLVKKDLADDRYGEFKFNIDSIDGYLPEEYTPEMLRERLK